MNLFVALKKADGCKSLIIIFLFRVVKIIHDQDTEIF